MSCSGCRILRKGCNENCLLRQSLETIDTPQAQANATVFVSKFFGRAGLMSFLSSVPQSQRPALFQSLLFEACGRTVNPVQGAVGLLWTGNWHLCQSAVDTVLRGGIPRSSPEFGGGHNNNLHGMRFKKKRRYSNEFRGVDDLGLTAGFPARMTGRRREKRRSGSPSDESETTTLESGFVQQHLDLQQNHHGHERKLLKLFL